MEIIFGGLIEFIDKNEMDSFLKKMSKNDAILIIEKSLEFSLKNGMFNLTESSIIYQSLQKIKTDENK